MSSVAAILKFVSNFFFFFGFFLLRFNFDGLGYFRLMQICFFVSLFIFFFYRWAFVLCY